MFYNLLFTSKPNSYHFVSSHYSHNCLGRNSAVSIATLYELDGPGIECRWRWGFPHLPRPALRSTLTPTQLVSSLFFEGEAAGAWRYPPTRIYRKVKERVELYLYSCSRPSWSVLVRNLPYSRNSGDFIFKFILLEVRADEFGKHANNVEIFLPPTSKIVSHFFLVSPFFFS
jgi:hypothetical protein